MKPFFGSALKLMSGNVFAQIISILTIPLITRIFGAEEFGSYSILLSISLIMSSIYFLGLNSTIIISKSDWETACIIKGVIRIALLISTLVSIVGCIYYSEISNLFGLKIEKALFIFFPILSILLLIHDIIFLLGVRKERYSESAKVRLLDSILERSSSIFIGLLSYSTSYVLLMCKIFSGIVSIIYFNHSVLRDNSVFYEGKQKIPFSRILSKYKRYVIFNTPSSLVMTLSLQAPLILMGLYFGPIVAGYFAIASRLVNIPGQMIGSTLSKLITKNLSEKWEVGEIDLAKVIRRYYLNITSILIYPFYLMVFIGDDFSLIILGDEWSDVGNILQCLAIISMSNLLVQCFSGLFDLSGKQNIRLGYHTLNAIVRTLSIVIPSKLGYGFETVIYVYATTGFSANVFALYMQFKQTSNSIFDLIHDSNIILSVLLLSGLSFIYNYVESNVYIEIVSVTLITFVCFLVTSGSRFIKVIRS